MKLFQYAIIKHPTDKEKENGKSSRLVVEVTTVLAENDKQATLMAGRAIPEAELKDIDRLEVAVRPF